MFIAIGTKRVNGDHVREVESTTRGGKTLVDVTFTDGTSKTYEAHAGFEDDMLSGTVIPAPDGYFSVAYSGPDDGLSPKGSVWTDPILAFQVSHDYLRPILLHGLASDDNDTAILRPDGKVDIPFDRVLDSLEAYREYKDDEFNSRKK